MAAHNQISSFVNKFLNLLYSGKSALLTAECHEGKMFAKVEMQMCIEDMWPPPPYHPPPSTQQRQPGPSRLRCRARRAHARAEAAAKAETTPPAADQAVPSVPQAKDAAAQAAPEVAEAAVQTADIFTPAHGTIEAAEKAASGDTKAAVEAASPPAKCDAAVQVALPGPVPLHPFLQTGQASQHQQAPAHLPPAAQDVFCPDGDYTTAWRAEHEQDRQLQSRKRREEQERDLQILENIIKTCAKS